ncbi:MAG: hypothetical protein WAO58_10830 [Fimbriimonadaceae bacterium]
MRRWAVGFVLVVLACVPVLLGRESGPQLLQDTDTKVLLETIRRENAPLSWFVQDWPLANHFYRPVSTLAFELDSRLYGDNPAGFGWTNALLCVAAVLLLFWFFRELTDDVVIATSGAVLFALWNAHWSGWAAVLAACGSWLLLALMLLPGRRPWPAILAWLGAWFLASELVGIRDLESRALDWIPGRTATIMTVFALIALASYCRFERLGAKRLSRADPGPLDPPATKGTSEAVERSGSSWLWLVLASLATLLALGSYEQAIMLPGALLAVAIYLRITGLRVRWAAHAVFWLALVAYFLIRGSLIGWERSGYQEQQFHSGGPASILFGISEYLTPEAKPIWTYLMSVELNWSLLFITQFYQVIAAIGSTVAAAILIIRRWRLPLLGLGLSMLAILPMLWLNDFAHYHYWPMAMRALFVVAFAKLVGQQIVIAASRPALQAPPRQRPAPGSLPRP